MSRFCEQCGSKLRSNENFCPLCGAKIVRDEPPKTYTPPKPSPPPQSTHVESTSSAESGMVKFLALIGILVIVFIGIYHANENATDKNSETALGELYLGMSKSEADDKYFEGVPQDNPGWYYYYFADSWLKVDSGNRVTKIVCNSPEVRTKKGIRIGSTLDEVKRAYGNGYEFDEVNFKGNPAYIYKVGRNELFFFIDPAGNTVCGIRLDAK